MLAKISKIIRNYRNYQRNLAEVSETKWSSGTIVNTVIAQQLDARPVRRKREVSYANTSSFFIISSIFVWGGGRGEDQELFLRYGS